MDGMASTASHVQLVPTVLVVSRTRLPSRGGSV